MRSASTKLPAPKKPPAPKPAPAMTPPPTVAGAAPTTTPLTTTPTPPAPQPSPVSPPPPAAAPQRWQDDFGVASDISNKILAGNEPKHVVDQYKGQTDDFLSILKERLAGLDSKEMLAAKEEGQASLNNQMAQSLERYGSIAGANGVQGGARAALMGKALHEQDLGRASLERNLILDNIAAKDKAAQAYGGALQGATNTALGVNKINTDADNAFTGLKLSMPFQVMSGIGGYRAEDRAKEAGDKELDVVQQYLKDMPSQQGPTTPQRNAVDQQDQTSIDKLTTIMQDAGAVAGSDVGTDKNKVYKAMDDAAKALRERINLQSADEPDEVKKQLFDEQWREWLWNAGLINKEGGWRGTGRGIQYMEFHY